MKKIAIGVGAVLGVAILGLVGAAAVQPDVITVERSKVIDATPADVWVHIADNKNLHAWSPWNAMDPDATYTFTDATTGVGSGYSWNGNDQVGVGTLTTTAVVEHQSLEQDLVFTAPWESDAKVSFTLVPEGDGTKVTWGFEEEPNFQMKLMTVFMSMDEMLGASYEEGLDNLENAALETRDARIAEEEAAKVAEETATEEGAEGAEVEGDVEAVEAALQGEEG